jgi:hypothetical protein
MNDKLQSTCKDIKHTFYFTLIVFRKFLQLNYKSEEGVKFV